MRLERQKPVARELTAQRRLDAAIDALRRKLADIESAFPGTRAAVRAREQLDALTP